MSEALAPDDLTDGARLYRELVQTIGDYEKWAKDWLDRSKKIIARYRDDRNEQISDERRARKFNVFWSNVQTLMPAVYAQKPRPQVERRFKDRDPVARVASETLERCVAFTTDGEAFDTVVRQCRDDYLLIGRGMAWVRYVPHFQPMAPEGMETPEQEVAEDGTQISGTVENEAAEAQRLIFEEVCFDYVAWRDFGHTPARIWEEVRQVWRKVQMTREDLVERFGEEVGNAVNLDARPEVGDEKDTTSKLRDQLYSRANVYEIWDKSRGKVFWLCKGYKDALLGEADDPLGLRDFFPCPRPLYATLTTDTLIPVPDYALYQDQAKELDELSERLFLLIKACKANGVYAGTEDSSIGRLMSEGTDNTLIPVDQWAAFADKGGIKGLIDFLPLDTIIKAIAELTGRFQAVKQEVYEITGIADIVRGYSQASETATAQQIKGRFATLRLQDRQKAVAQFARDLMALAGEIIAEHFNPQTIALMSGIQEQPQDDQQLFPQAVALLRQDAMRRFRIDIETDSTIAADEQADKQAAVELMQAIGTGLRDGLPLAAQAPEILPLLEQGMLFTIRRFKGGRTFEAAVEQSFERLLQRAQQAQQQPPQPDPDVEKAKAELALKQQEAQLAAQLEQQKAEAQIALKTREHEQSMQMQRERAELDMTIAREKASLDLDLRQWEAQQRAMLAREAPREVAP